MNSENMLCEPVYNHAIHFITQLAALLQTNTDQQIPQQVRTTLQFASHKQLLKSYTAMFKTK